MKLNQFLISEKKMKTSIYIHMIIYLNSPQNLEQILNLIFNLI